MNWWGTKSSTSQGPNTLCLEKLDHLLEDSDSHTSWKLPSNLSWKKHMLRLREVEWCFRVPGYSQLRFLSPILKIESITLWCNISYEKSSISSNIWWELLISHILWNLFKGHFAVTKNFCCATFPKKPLKNFQKGLQERTPWTNGFRTRGNRNLGRS